MKITHVAVSLGLALVMASARAEAQQAGEKLKPIVGYTSQGEKVVLPAGEISWADEVVDGKVGVPAPKVLVDAKAALGRPDDPSTREKAVAGFSVPLGHGGWVVLKFTDNVLVDVPGPDLVIFESGPKIEPTSIAISVDGKTWIDVGTTAGATSLLDIGKYVQRYQRYTPTRMEFRYIRIVDAKRGLSNDSRFAGADIDAVGAIGSEPVSMSPTD
jgi:hypothetical protein